MASTTTGTGMTSMVSVCPLFLARRLRKWRSKPLIPLIPSPTRGKGEILTRVLALVRISPPLELGEGKGMGAKGSSKDVRYVDKTDSPDGARPGRASTGTGDKTAHAGTGRQSDARSLSAGSG